MDNNCTGVDNTVDVGLIISQGLAASFERHVAGAETLVASSMSDYQRHELVGILKQLFKAMKLDWDECTRQDSSGTVRNVLAIFGSFSGKSIYRRRKPDHTMKTSGIAQQQNEEMKALRSRFCRLTNAIGYLVEEGLWTTYNEFDWVNGAARLFALTRTDCAARKRWRTVWPGDDDLSGLFPSGGGARKKTRKPA